MLEVMELSKNMSKIPTETVTGLAMALPLMYELTASMSKQSANTR
jgi:hypothetical protein